MNALLFVITQAARLFPFAIEPGFADFPTQQPQPDRNALRDATPFPTWRPNPHGEL